MFVFSGENDRMPLMRSYAFVHRASKSPSVFLPPSHGSYFQTRRFEISRRDGVAIPLPPSSSRRHRAVARDAPYPPYTSRSSVASRASRETTLRTTRRRVSIDRVLSFRRESLSSMRLLAPASRVVASPRHRVVARGNASGSAQGGLTKKPCDVCAGTGVTLCPGCNALSNVGWTIDENVQQCDRRGYRAVTEGGFFGFGAKKTGEAPCERCNGATMKRKTPGRIACARCGGNKYLYFRSADWR